MTVADQFGLTLTLGPSVDPARAAQAWDRTVTAFLAHAAATPAHLAETLEAAPSFALAHAAKGYFMLLLGRRELIPTAREAYQAAAPERAAVTDRERAVIDGLGLYLDGRLTAAGDLLDQTLRRYPGDALLMKLVHAIRFVLGDAVGMRASLEAAMPAYGGDHPSRGYANGCLAFALEETGAYLEAERVGRDAMARAASDGFGDAWGLHAVAHVYDMTNRCTEGVAWIRKQPDAWAHCNNFGYHVWWHLALFHLDRGEQAETLRLYDEEIRREHTDDYRDISNAASLLARLEFDGVDVGARWEELAQLSEGRIDDDCVVFADLHYLLALGADHREDAAARMVARLRSSAERRIGCMDGVAANAGVPAAEGLRSFANADYAGAFAHLRSAAPNMPQVGASHAQRDVFERVAIESALRAGLLPEARAALQERTSRRGALDSYAEKRLARISELEKAGGIIAAE